jgi:hypothetical protein
MNTSHSIKALAKVHRAVGHEAMIEEASDLSGWDVDDSGHKEVWFSRYNRLTEKVCRSVKCPEYGGAA